MKILNQLDDAAEPILAGKIGVIPTDTVYGLVAKASDKQAVSDLYKTKSRELKPGTIIAANMEQLVELGIPKRYLSAVNQFWPNSISVVVPVGLTLDYLHLGKQSLAVRIPKHEALLGLLEKTGPLATTSANQPGEPTATTMQQAQDYFDNRVDFYVDDGDLSGRKPSTIIRIVDDAVEILREGAVKINDKGEIEP